MPKGKNNFLNNHFTFFNARSAIKYLFDFLEPKEIWVPSFLCPTIIQGNHNFYFYDCDLFEDLEKFYELANKKENIFYFIDYFGFAKKIKFKNKKCKVVQDCSQSIFLKKHPSADYSIYSFPKMLSVFDGGSIMGLNKKIIYNKENEHYKTCDYNNFQALTLRRKNDVNWRDYYLKSKNKLVGNYDMTRLSKKIISNCNLNKIKSKQIKNYNFLSKFIKPLFELRGNSDVPIGFPIFSNQRDKVLNIFIENKIFCPIHWKINSGFSKAKFIEKRILTIPCTWCYSIKDMKKIIYVIKKNNLINLIEN